MKRPSCFSELESAVRPYSRRLTNNYLMAADMRRLIETGNLFYTLSNEAVYLFERREGYYKLFFQLNEACARLPRCELPLVSYVVYRGANKNGRIRSWLEAQGFALLTEQIHLTADEPCVIPPLGEVDRASREEARELFLECFGPYRADLPLAGYCGEFLAVRGESGESLGIIHCGSPIIIAVKEKARGQKIGKRLFLAYCATNRGRPLKLWTDVDNLGSQQFYKQFGLVPDGLRAALYIKM